MNKYTYVTTDKSDVDQPEWAEGMEVGDTIRWQTEQVDTVQKDEIVGFSTLYDWGYPCIVAPSERIDSDNDRAETCAVTEDSVVLPDTDHGTLVVCDECGSTIEELDSRPDAKVVLCSPECRDAWVQRETGRTVETVGGSE